MLDGPTQAHVFGGGSNGPWCHSDFWFVCHMIDLISVLCSLLFALLSALCSLLSALCSLLSALCSLLSALLYCLFVRSFDVYCIDLFSVVLFSALCSVVLFVRSFVRLMCKLCVFECVVYKQMYVYCLFDL